MTAAISSRDLQEIISRLSSEKSRTREEGVKLLNAWLEGERSAVFCRFLSEKSSLIKSNDIPHPDSWPVLVKILIQCVAREISSSKKRAPKLNFAQTLRAVVRMAVNDIVSGESYPLLHVAKSLFTHILDVLKDVPSFHSEYVVILRYLLGVRNYRFQMRKQVYSNLVLLFMEKVEASLSRDTTSQSKSTEFSRYTLTLQSLIENTHGDVPNELREEIIKAFVRIFSHVRVEEKFPRKLLECVNAFLLNDGPNLGSKCLLIHNALEQCITRHWCATPDKNLKESFITYMKLQLSLTRCASDGTALFAQLLDLVHKELDHLDSSNPDVGRDDKCGVLMGSNYSLLDLAALLFSRLCSSTQKTYHVEKRAKQEHTVTLIEHKLIEGKWSWHAVFCFIIRDYSDRLKVDIFVMWFHGITRSFESIVNYANSQHSYDGLLWTLRSLCGLSSLLLGAAGVESSPKSYLCKKEVSQLKKGLHVIWNCLVRSMPIFGTSSVVDAALNLLSIITLNDMENRYLVPIEIWDLLVFNQLPSLSALCFMTIHFSGRNSHGNPQDVLLLRRSMLREVLGVLKKSSSLDAQLVFIVPAAAYALCVGFAPLMDEVRDLLSSFCDPNAMVDQGKAVKPLSSNLGGQWDCSVEILSMVENGCSEAKLSEHYRHTHLSQKLRKQLLHEMENCVLEFVRTKEILTMLFSDLINTCALLSNFMCCSYLARVREEATLFFTQLGDLMLEILGRASAVIDEAYEKSEHGHSGPTCLLSNLETSLVSCKSFMSSPLLGKWKEKDNEKHGLYSKIVQYAKELLRSLENHYEKNFLYRKIMNSEKSSSDFSESSYLYGPQSLSSSKSLDSSVELDANTRSSDADCSSVSGDQKLDYLQLLSNFFSILPSVAWDILFNLHGRECDQMVSERVLFILCHHPYWTSCQQLADLVTSMTDALTISENLKLPCTSVLQCLCALFERLQVLHVARKHVNRNQSSRDIIPVEIWNSLGDLMNGIFKSSSLTWVDRIKIIDCICNFVSCNPQIAQPIVEQLFVLLHDPDYRVRLHLGRRIGILFQTWDGHFELFQDVYSNLGVKLVFASAEKLVRAEEVLAIGPQSIPVLETAIITLMHLVLHSEQIELQAVFMICVVAAIEPEQRELVHVVLDKLSLELNYSNRAKYLEVLMGPILFSWVACGISLVALVETRDLYLANAEAVNFIQYCCQWLLPALMLQEDAAGINFVAKVSCQPCAVLVKCHFVHIFSISMGVYCSKKAGSERGSRVLGTLILQIGEMSEQERDDLIKKHLVSIVNHCLSLASNISGPLLPYFPKDTISCAIRTIVDGFVDSEENTLNPSLVDKINILRPDRVFMFIVDLHYKITAAAHHRHKSNILTGVQTLVNLLGCRAALPSTFNYLINIAGQFIDCGYLMEQCCHIVSMLLKILKGSPSRETNRVLGEQLQFLMSKLVACSVSSDSHHNNCETASSQVLQLLQQLTVDSDSSLHDYIKELELFPEHDAFGSIRDFHHQICASYSSRDHLLNFLKRSLHLPQRLLLCSLKALHKNMSNAREKEKENFAKFLKDAIRNSDKEVLAFWNLVRVCSLESPTDVGSMVSDFVSMVGIDDPHRVVFYFPENHMHVSDMVKVNASMDPICGLDTDLSSEVLLLLVRLFKKYLMDDSVEIIDMASQALRGILSTERGQRILLLLDSYEKSLVEVHSGGANVEFVERLVRNLERKASAKSLSFEDLSLWSTSGKTFKEWICPLVYAMIRYCDDVILRLCQDVVLVKVEVAELLFSHAIVNIAGRMNSGVDLCTVISSKIQECIFSESNMLIRSIQVTLNALNELRLCHMIEKMRSAAAQNKARVPRQNKALSSGLKSNAMLSKGRDQGTAGLFSTLTWERVYWLHIDYLIVAKSAIKCGSNFTAYLYVEHWCEQHFNGLNLGSPDFSHHDTLPLHLHILVSAVTQINEPDGLYGIIQSHKLSSQVVIYEHEGNWTKALEYYDLQARTEALGQMSWPASHCLEDHQKADHASSPKSAHSMMQKKPYRGLIRSLQQIGCSHLLNIYCQGLTSRREQSPHDIEFNELQYEAAWRAGNWDFLPIYSASDASDHCHCNDEHHFNENLHCCLRAIDEGEREEFTSTVKNAKQALLVSISHASPESTQFIYSAILKLQIFCHLEMAWNLRWVSSLEGSSCSSVVQRMLTEPVIPSRNQLKRLSKNWNCILEQLGLHMNLLEPFVAFRGVLLQVLKSVESTLQHLLESASLLRKGSRISQATAALHEFKLVASGIQEHSNLYWLGRLEEAKILRAQGQREMAINLADYIAQNHQLGDEAPNAFRLVGKWLAETRSSNSRTILEKYLKHAVNLAEDCTAISKLSSEKRSQMHFHLARYADALFRSHEERLCSSEWQVAMRLRKHKKKELDALLKRFKGTVRSEKADYSFKIQELQKQLAMDREEEQRLQEDRDNLLCTALSGYKQCLIIGEKYDVPVVFRLTSMWFSLSARQIVIDSMLSTIKEVQSYKFVALVYQIASRIGSTRVSSGPTSFQFALISLVKKMALDHPYHTIFQLLSLSNGDRIKDKQRSRNSFVVDMDKKIAAEDLLRELSFRHGAIINQMNQMVEIYVKLAEMETKREDTNRRVTLPRDIRSVRELELVPVVTSQFPVDHTCQYPNGFFPHFKGLVDTVVIMNGINAPKVVECLGSDGIKYRQLAKSGNDDLRQDAVMEQFFGLVNTFLRNNRDTWRRRLSIRTYKVVPFTPSAGVLEWVNGTFPLGEYLIGSSRNGGAHGRYGVGDWTFMECRQKMASEVDKCKAFQEVCEHFRPVMHNFFLERFLNPADWFERRLAYTRSVATSSMVGYIVGLGDRHAMNILIDQATAEVVHIDLGVAFEQGLMLKTPERVPFRLTRDIVDGMGITGVEGVFRRCCEESLSVMRTNKEALLTIVEVFIHDPLYKWALSPLKALQRQKDIDDESETSLEDSDEDDCEGNKDAARALLRVKQKLDGYEDGEMRSVHGQVQQLIQDAIDPDRLCNMFPGWGAWL